MDLCTKLALTSMCVGVAAFSLTIIMFVIERGSPGQQWVDVIGTGGIIICMLGMLGSVIASIASIWVR